MGLVIGIPAFWIALKLCNASTFYALNYRNGGSIWNALSDASNVLGFKEVLSLIGIALSVSLTTAIPQIIAGAVLPSLAVQELAPAILLAFAIPSSAITIASAVWASSANIAFVIGCDQTQEPGHAVAVEA